MARASRQTLTEYLALEYPFQVIASRDGGYVITYPDLPGCLTQADSLDEIAEMADEARRLWIEAEYEDGRDIPLPSYPEEYSGKFVARVPRSLHRQLAEEADRQGVSLNQLVVALLAQGGREAHFEQRLAEVEANLSARLDQLTGQVEGLQYPVVHMPASGDRRAKTSSRTAMFGDPSSRYPKAS
jgi:antitoxin HicB